MKIRRGPVIVVITALLGIAFLAIGVIFQPKTEKKYGHSLRHPQHADSIAGYPIKISDETKNQPAQFTTTKFEPNLSTLSPLERFFLPTAYGFLPPNGKPIASATALVVFTGAPEGYPGKTILLAHRLPDGQIIQTLYAGLSRITHHVGDHLPRGTSLGTLGNHPLYFEIRKGPAIDIHRETIGKHTLNDQHAPKPPNRLDQQAFFAKHQLPPNAPPDPLQITQQKEKEATLNQLRSKLPPSR